LNFYIGQLTEIAGFESVPEHLKTSLNEEKIDSAIAKDAVKYLDSLNRRFRQLSKKARDMKDSVSKSIVTKIGREQLINLQDNYYNKRLEEYVLARTNVSKTFENQNKIVQKYEPIYMKPVSKYGRAQFYAPYKQIGDIPIDTFWFNMLVLWFVTLVLYVALYFNLLQKAVTYFENLRFTRS
jgi:hypothetical protein